MRQHEVTPVMDPTSEDVRAASSFAWQQADRVRGQGRFRDSVFALATDVARHWAFRKDLPRPSLLTGAEPSPSRLAATLEAQDRWLESATDSAVRAYLDSLTGTLDGYEETGEFVSSPSMTDIAVTALTARLPPAARGNPVTVLDYASGASGMLRASARAFEGKGYPARVLGQELNHEVAQIGAATLFVAGIPGDIQVADSLTSDAFATNRADYAVSQPPFGLSWKAIEKTVRERKQQDGWYRIGLPQTSDSTWLFVSRMVDKLKPPETGGGRAVIFAAQGSLFGSGGSEVRSSLLEADLLEAVIGLPSGVAPGIQAALYALVFSNVKPESRHGQVQLIDLRAYFETSSERHLGRRKMRGDAVEVLAQALTEERSTASARMKPNHFFTRRRLTVRRTDTRGPGPRMRSPSWEVDVPVSVDPSDFLAARYATDVGVRLERTGETHTTIEIDSSFDPTYARVQKWLRERHWQGTRLSQLLLEVPLASPRDDSATEPPAVLLPTGQGDAAVAVGQPPKDGRWLMLRPDPELLSAHFLASWLNSPLGKAVRRRAINAAGTGAVIKVVRSGSRRDLMRLMDELVVPLPPRTSQDQLADADAKLAAVLTLTDNARAEIWDRPRATRDILARFDPLFDESLSNWSASLPYPIAASLWTLESKSANLDATLKQMLLVWESYIIFTGTMLISALGQDPALAEELRPALRKALERGNVSMERATIGSWNAIVKELSAAFRRMLESDDPDERARLVQLFGGPTEETLAQLISSEVIRLFQDANTKRNTWSAHSGTLTDADLRDRIGQLTDRLQELRISIGGAWTELQLVRPGAASLSGGETTQQVEIAVGPNTPFRQGVMRVGKMMDQKNLYLAAEGAAQPLPLEPFVMLRASPDHVRNTAYFYNRLEGAEVRMVCYHLADHSEVTEPLPDVLSAVTGFLGA